MTRRCAGSASRWSSKGDFASGTSSKSSKLIHGGLRYLENYEFALVLEASRERDHLRRHLAPHLVHPMPFVFPIFRGDPVGRLRLSAGLWVYDGLSAFRNIARHRSWGHRTTLRHEPQLRADGLRGAMHYYDCWTDDARLTLETIQAAIAAGAIACNHLGVTELVRDGRTALGGARVDRSSERHVLRDHGAADRERDRALARSRPPPRRARRRSPCCVSPRACTSSCRASASGIATRSCCARRATGA